MTITATEINCFLSPRISPVQTVAERIKQKRTQMMNIRDGKLQKPYVDNFEAWANDLQELQKIQHWIGFHDEEFLGWKGYEDAILY